MSKKNENELTADNIFRTTWLFINYTGVDDDKTKERHSEFIHKNVVEALDAKDAAHAQKTKELVSALENILSMTDQYPDERDIGLVADQVLTRWKEGA